MSDERNLPTVLSRMLSRITEYLDSGGLWNPELADHAAVCDLILDARDEIVRLRERLAAVEAENGFACRLVAKMHLAATGETTGPTLGVVEDVLAFRQRAERAERILAALREPSQQVKKAVGRDEFMRLFTGEWETIPVGYDLTAAMILAAVKAAEREVGNV